MRKRKQLHKCKRSQAHVEMILSFIIFVGFITVMLILLNPIKTRPISTTILDITEIQLSDYLSISYDTIPLFLDNETDKTHCIAIEKKRIRTDKSKVLVKDITGEIVPASIDGNYIYIEPEADSNFYRLFFSEDFTETADDLDDCNELEFDVNYTLGILNKKSNVFIPKIENFTLEYQEEPDGYEELKNKLNLTNDFEVYVYDEDDIEIYSATTYKPGSIDIVARNVPTLAVDANAEVIDITLNIRAW